MLPDLFDWDPLRNLDAMRSEMERIAHLRGEGTLPRRWSPVSDVIESEDAIVITAELPGVKDEDIAITVQNGVLSISGERNLAEEVSEDRYHRIERSYGGFARRFVLPPGIEEKDISAGVAYGVLKVTIPKPSSPVPRVIPINPAG